MARPASNKRERVKSRRRRIKQFDSEIWGTAIVQHARIRGYWRAHECGRPHEGVKRTGKGASSPCSRLAQSHISDNFGCQERPRMEGGKMSGRRSFGR
jgi:hypothetical protein